MDSWKSAFQVPAVKSLSLAQPARMPMPLFGLSEASSLNIMGAWITVMPLTRAAATTLALFASMSVAFIDSATAPCSLPPSVVNSFWYSMRTKAVLDRSSSHPPLACADVKVRADDLDEQMPMLTGV